MAMLPPGWIALGGKSRNFFNAATGETLSRRQFDKKFGALAKGGFASYEKKAAASVEEERRARPARGRGSQKASASKAGPLQGKLGRTFYDGADAESYDEMLGEIKSNSKILHVMSGALFEFENGSMKKFFMNKNGQTIMSPPELIIDGDTAYFYVINGMFADESPHEAGGDYDFEHFAKFFFTVRYKDEFFRAKPEKEKVTKRAKSRAKAKTKRERPRGSGKRGRQSKRK